MPATKAPFPHEQFTSFVIFLSKPRYLTFILEKEGTKNTYSVLYIRAERNTTMLLVDCRTPIF